MAVNNPFTHKQKELDADDLFVWVDFFCERYGWSVDEVLELPIPTFYALQKAISYRNEEEKKGMKKK